MAYRVVIRDCAECWKKESGVLLLVKKKKGGCSIQVFA
jgi:hypothetical protein